MSAIGVSPADLEKEAEKRNFLLLKLEEVEREEAERVRAARIRGVLILHGASGELLLSGSRYDLNRLCGALRRGEEPALADEIAAALARQGRVLAWGRRSLDFRRKTYVMGILNCTPDSFYPGSRLHRLEQALEAARNMISAGADILDVGGESTRPGSEQVSAEEERNRVIPLIELLRRESDILISIDTRKWKVAEAALDAGADLVNDVSALRNNRPLAELVAERGVPVVLMHMRGEPKTMQENPYYENAVSEIIKELRGSIDLACRSGISRDKIIVDPGIGFGKRVADNLSILKYLGSFRSLGCPLLIGLSRKSFLGAVTGAAVEDRLAATIAADTIAVLHGADIVRVHDAREAVEMARLIEAVRGAC
mgnify:CR=1 FL=1